MRHRILAAFASTLLAVAPAALAQITFTNIVDSTTPTFRGGFASPSINAAGSVGFFATFNPPQGQGLFSGNGTTITTIALTGSIYGGFSPSGTGPSINAAGRLGFHAHLTPSAGGGSGLFLSDGTTTAPIALSSGPYSDFGDPASNDSGTLGFWARLDAGGSGLFTSNGTTTTSIALTSGPTYNDLDLFPSINTAGTLGFRASLDTGDNGLFTSDGTTTTTIALTSDPTFSFFYNHAINAAGNVGFLAELDAGGHGLFTSDGVTMRTIALESGPLFSGFGGPSINTAGMLGFMADLDAGGRGLFVSDGTTTTEVIKSGDLLFGSTVTAFFLGGQALNDAGQLTFAYNLADGRSGIAVAYTVPEPTTALLLGTAGFPLLLRQRRGQHGPARIDL